MRRLVGVAVLVCGVVPLIEAGPAAATAWSVSLSTSAADADAGATVTLTATVNQTLTGTGYYLDVFDQSTGEPIGFCNTGTSCSITHSEPAAGTHTYIAYVDNDPVFHYPPCCVQATSNTVTVRWHARATAVFDVEFSVSGTLPVFPCNGCGAGLSGSGSGSGSAHAESGGTAYEAAFVMPSGWVSGSADYTEPRTPICPGLGSATGTVTLSGPATGVITRTTTTATTGSVTGATFTLTYSYQRVGGASAIVITGGSARIYFTFPGSGADYFVGHVEGAGPGAFVTDPALVVQRCQSPGSLPFTVIGDVALKLT